MTETTATPPTVQLPGQHALEQQVLREGPAGWELVGSRCPQCATYFYPPRRLCAKDLTVCDEITLSPRGTLYEATLVRIAPVGFRAPFWLGYVDLPENVRVFAQIEWHGDDQPRHGNSVELTVRTVRRDPVEVRGPVFRGPA